MSPYVVEQWRKQPQDLHPRKHRVELVEGAIIVGAGPSGMATAACLQERGVPYVLLERSDCIASLWKQKTYDRLHLHIAKHYCELPLMPFPVTYPNFLTREQFLAYLDDYARKFNIQPRFSETVQSAGLHGSSDQKWHVCTGSTSNTTDSEYCNEYIGKWLIVASGENAEIVLPQLHGLNDFKGTVVHSSQYRNGSEYAGKRVLVVGSGNSGMEIALDLVNSGAKSSSIAARSPLHVLPREMFGKSTFSVAMGLTKIFPVWVIDYLLVSYSLLKLGNTSLYGLRRPKIGPLELKNKMGKTPILDVGTFARIQSGDIKVRPGVECLTATGARFLNGTTENYDEVILATGYKSDVPRWLNDEDCFFTADGLPTASTSSQGGNWKGKKGLYAAGLSGKGLLGASMEAQLIAEDIRQAYFAGQSSVSRSI